ncbi:unnamed protein product [Sphenostylis stenocarpa]|uniref:Uncharacterized protein n=1 Tax=Sphenostylis stenocarpa TaxID=92480 RepID=A0AA86VCV1_9FABA|nr:unnamed protein product [Sphenostylis stenocarpa]
MAKRYINGHCRFLWLATWVVAFSTPAVLFVAKQLLGWDQIDTSCSCVSFSQSEILAGNYIDFID